MKRLSVVFLAVVVFLLPALSMLPLAQAESGAPVPGGPAAAVPAAAEPDLAAIYRQFIDALNRGDVAAALGLLTDDVEQVSGGFCPCQGKASIQRQLQTSIAGHIQIKIVDVQVSGSVLTTREEVITDGIKAAGFERIINKQTATFRGDKIARRVIEDDLTDPQTAALRHFQNVTALLRSLADFRNRGEAAIAAGFFTEDAEFQGGGCAPCTGRDAIQQLFEQQTRTTGDRFTVSNFKVTGNTASFRQQVDFTGTRPFGVIGRIFVTITIELRDGKITSWRSATDLTDPQTVEFANLGRLAGIHSQYEAAVNRGDIATALTFLTDSTVRVDLASCREAPCVGKEAVGAALERRAAAVTVTAFGPPQFSDGVFTVRTQVTGSQFEAAGVQRLINVATFEFAGDKIARVTVMRDLSDPQTAAFVAAQQGAAPARFPATGSAGLADEGGPAALPWAVGAAAAAFAGAGVLLKRRGR